jgi:hypothetical protein
VSEPPTAPTIAAMPAPEKVMSKRRLPHSGVTTTPGAKALTVILCLANSRAPAWVSEITADLLQQ